PPETVAMVFRHSRGFPRLINTICENALITAYARQMPGVTPDIISDVAKEFRLDVVTKPDVDRNGFNEMDAQRVISVLLDLYSALRRPGVAGQAELGAPVIAGTEEHEPDI